MTNIARRIQVIDSHTGGEPTRVVISGGPDLGGGTLPERRERFRLHFDEFRSAVVNEPRGSDVMVGALVCEPYNPRCVCGVIFFNNVGYLHMCGHGTIGVAITLAHLGRIGPGRHFLDTPVGVVAFEFQGGNTVMIENVPSYRYAHCVAVPVEGIGSITGDVAWGGNWFFLVHDHGQMLELANADRLIDFTWRIRQSLEHAGISGADGQEIDHIELFGPARNPGADSRNFVLCPGHAYDRSPCGTGTSAKLACLFADGKLHENQIYRQESIIGSIFEGEILQVRSAGDGFTQIVPLIRGSAYVTAEATLLLDAADPFQMGIRKTKSVSGSE